MGVDDGESLRSLQEWGEGEGEGEEGLEVFSIQEMWWFSDDSSDGSDRDRD